MTQNELKNLPDGILVKISITGLGDYTTSIKRSMIKPSAVTNEIGYFSGSMFVSAKYISVLSEAEIEEQYQKSLKNLKQTYESKLKALKEYRKEV